jgi:hypothetical protein
MLDGRGNTGLRGRADLQRRWREKRYQWRLSHADNRSKIASLSHVAISPRRVAICPAA